MPMLLRGNLLPTAGLALAYVLAAAVGHWATIGPDDSSAVWPAAGVALAAMMLWGRRALPGLVVGMLAASGVATLGPQAQVDARGLVAAAVITLADLAQAVLAARVLADFPRRVHAHPLRETARFVVVVGVACCLSAIASQAALLAVQPDAIGELPLAAVAWWGGGVTGTLVVAPGLLLLLHPALRAERLAIQAFPLVCLGLGLTLFCTIAVGVVDRAARIARFEADANRLALTMQNHFELTGRDLETLQHHFLHAALDPAEFRAVAAPLLARSPWQATFAWLPRVARADRADFEAAPDGLGGISVREIRPDGTVVRAGARAEYFPVALAEPAAGRESLVGIDPAADAAHGAAIAFARGTGIMAATPPLYAAADSPDGRAVQMLVLPLGERADGRAASYDPHHVRGLVAAMVDLATLLRVSLAQMDVHGQAVLLLDPDAPDSVALQWDEAGGVRAIEPVGRAQALAAFTGGDARRHTLRVADRQWDVRQRPGWAGALPRFTWLQAGVLSSGLVFTALLTAFLSVRRRRDQVLQEAHDQLEAQVLARTRDLAATNRRLLDEIAGHRHTEHLLQDARQHAESANRAKSLFLANMSHEIRTPLNAVLGYTQLLIEDRRQSGQARERLRIIHSAGQRLLGLINDVLDLAKIEAGGLQVNLGPMALRRELADIGALFEPRAAAKGLRLRVELALPGDDAPRLADRAKFGQVVLNLLGNALKFTDHGEIVLRAWRADDDETVVEVADTGPGMDAPELAGLFTPFRQGSAGAQKGGTGLGLSLSRSIAHALGGELEIESHRGVGTRVRLRLPMPQAASGAVAPARHPGGRRLAPGSACRALVVEDDVHSRDVLATLLRDAGCEVAVAVDGAAGLAACLAAAEGAPGEAPRAFDIVFSDIRMPRMDGLEMMRRLRADPRTRALPLVAVSASSLEHERRFYMGEGFHDFVGKPYDFEEIYAMLARHARAVLVARPDEEPSAAAEAGGADAPDTATAAAPSAGVRHPAELAAARRIALAALADGAATGSLAAVRAALAALSDLGPGALPPGLQAQLEADLRLYDFAAIEERVRALAVSGAPAEDVKS